jgi:hypothetical protein
MRKGLTRKLHGGRYKRGLVRKLYKRRIWARYYKEKVMAGELHDRKTWQENCIRGRYGKGIK